MSLLVPSFQFVCVFVYSVVFGCMLGFFSCLQMDPRTIPTIRFPILELDSDQANRLHVCKTCEILLTYGCFSSAKVSKKPCTEPFKALENGLFVNRKVISWKWYCWHMNCNLLFRVLAFACSCVLIVAGPLLYFYRCLITSGWTSDVDKLVMEPDRMECQSLHSWNQLLHRDCKQA